MWSTDADQGLLLSNREDGAKHHIPDLARYTKAKLEVWVLAMAMNHDHMGLADSLL